MKLLIFSDVHGSIPVAERICELAALHADAPVLLLGDMLYHGPRNPLPDGYAPRTVVDVLAPLAPRIMAVKGNCDSEVDESLLPFPLAPVFSWVMDASLSGRPLRICATHGHIYNPAHLPPLEAGDMLLFGHTHVPAAYFNEQGVAVCNPGSLALPKEGSPASYGVYEQGVFTVMADSGKEYARLALR